MKLLRTLIAICTVAALFVTASAEEYVGGLGTNWVQSALTLPPGSAVVNSHGQAWVGTVGGLSGIKTASAALSVNFGYSNHSEIGICQITYMDPNWGANTSNLNTTLRTIDDSYIIPGDLMLRYKYGNLSTTIGQLYVVHAFTFGLRYRVAKYNNLPMYPYFGGGNAPSLTWSASWYDRPLYPSESNFLTWDMTYTHHNDGTKASESAQSLSYGIAYNYAMQNMHVGAQIYGMAFLKEPVRTVYSREPYAYFAPYVNFQLFEGMELLLSPEVLVNKAKNSTNNPSEPKYNRVTGLGDPDLLNYAPWRFTGMIRIKPSTTFYSTDPFAKAGQGRRGAGAAALRERLARESKESLFDWTVDSERDLQFLNLDLEKTRIERQKAEEELLKLKNEIGK